MFEFITRWWRKSPPAIPVEERWKPPSEDDEPISPRELFGKLVDNMAKNNERPCLACKCGKLEETAEIITKRYGEKCPACGEYFCLTVMEERQ